MANFNLKSSGTKISVQRFWDKDSSQSRSPKGQTAEPPQPEQHWQTRYLGIHVPSAAEKAQNNLQKHFKGKWGFRKGRCVLFPDLGFSSDLEGQQTGQQLDDYLTATDNWDSSKGEVVKTKDGKYQYRNEFHQVKDKFRDVAVYLSPTNAVPRRLRIQATPYVLKQMEEQAKHCYPGTGDWMRNKMKGSVPLVLKLSEWALSPFGKNQEWYWQVWHKIDGTLRLLVIAVPLQVMLSLPGLADWEDDRISDTYTDFPGYYWDWPKYARNHLETAPGPDGEAVPWKLHSLDVRGRSTRPRKIVLLMENGQWEVVEADRYPSVSYVFISYEWRQFTRGKDETGRDIKDVAKIQRMAEKITLRVMKHRRHKAYWLDDVCNYREPGAELDYDVYTMCDVVRSSARVAILLGEDTPDAKLGWGLRLWTLPEGLLAPGDSIVCCHEDHQGTLQWDEVSKVEMTSSFWGQADGSQPWEGGGPIRLLAEHFSGLLTLSRLELMPYIIQALEHTHWSNKDQKHSDLAYAVMCFLHYRIERNEEDTLFQGLARLSLSNDSDQIVERMVSTCPAPRPIQINPKTDASPDHSRTWSALTSPDQFGTRIHDIAPLCDVVGVAHEDETVIIDNARGVHIRWKDFPKAVVRRHDGLGRLFATFFVAAGVWLLGVACKLAVSWVPVWVGFQGTQQVINDLNSRKYDDEIFALALTVFVLVLFSLIFSLLSPFSVRRLFGGRVEKSSPHLVGFEGVMPIHDLEKMVFGNCEGRLTYAPSSTPFCGERDSRHPRERKGKEPPWIAEPHRMREFVKHEVPDSHRIFTLVDMGDLSVSIFSAERPPTVMLLCGREGGMVRAVLCSWRFENDCLYKENVIRMPSTVYEAAKPKDWLKLCLQTQDEARHARRVRRTDFQK